MTNKNFVNMFLKSFYKIFGIFLKRNFCEELLPV